MAMFAVAPSPSPPKPAPATPAIPITETPVNKPVAQPLPPLNTPQEPAKEKSSPKEQDPQSPQKEVPADDGGVRRLIILQNFDENQVKDKTVQMKILFNNKMTKLPSEQHPMSRL